MPRYTLCCVSFAAMLLACPATSICAENPGTQPRPPEAPASSALPALHLNDAQRETIRKTLVSKHSDIEFQLKSTKAAKDFTPAVGTTLPKGVDGQALPSEVTAQIPELRTYWYVTMDDQILIVNGMSRKIVDMFSETRPLMQ